MGKELLKWLSALVTGGAAAGLAYINTHTGTGPVVDPWLGALILGLVARLVGFLGSKIPAGAP